MDCSQNELTALLYKAAVGCGVPVGLAQDTASAIVWLAARGHDAIGPFLHALADTAPDDSPFACGQSAVDLALASPSTPVQLSAVAQPILVIGFAGAAATTSGCRFAIEMANGASVVVDATSATITGDLTDGCDLTVCATGDAANIAPQHLGAVVVADDAWQQASIYAARTYVPATEASRLKGAGAGLTDND